MKTLAQKIEHDGIDQYGLDVDPTTPEGAKLMLRSRGGKKAAGRAMVQLWRIKQRYMDGYLPTAQILAPLRVLMALELIGQVERAENEDNQLAWRFRLTPKGEAEMDRMMTMAE